MKLLASIFFGSIVSCVYAAVWTGNGVDNRWSTKENWNNNSLPSDGDTITINNGKECDIEIATGEEVLVGQVLVGSTVATKVRFYGGGKMARYDDSNNNNFIYANSALVVDGIEWNIKNSGFSVQNGAVLEVRSGSTYAYPGSGTVYMYDNSKLIVSGGSLEVQRLSRTALAQLIVTGGVMNYRADNGASGESSGITFTGGTLMVPPNTVTDKLRLPTKEGSVLVARNASTSVSGFTANGSYMLRGDIVGTNNWSAGSLFPYLLINNNVNIGGRGKWYLGSLFLDKGRDTRAKLDLRELIVGHMNHGNSGSVAEFFDGMVLRPMGEQLTFTGVHSYWHGLLNVDTTDYANKSIGRTVLLDNNYPLTTVGIRVFASGEGKGKVRYCFPNLDAVNKRHIDYVEVADGAALSFEAGALANPTVRVGALKVGRNCTLTIMGAALRVASVSRAAEIDPTATIEYIYNGTPVEMNRYMILDMGPGGDVSQVNITTPEGLPSGWRIVKDGQMAYLTDDVTMANPDSSTGNGWHWIGAVGGNWSQGGNWAINKNNLNRDKYAGVNQTIYFLGYGCTAVTNDVDNLSIARFEFLNGSGFVHISGKPITITQTGTGSTAPLLMNSMNRTGAVFDTKIIGTSTAAFFVGPNVGYFSFLKGIDATDACLWIAGEERFGGESTFRDTKVHGVRNSDGQAGYAPSLALITNATFTVTNQETDWDYTGSFSLRIDEGAKLHFASTGTRYRPTFEFANTTINGLLDIDIPFYVVGRQSFYGKGAIDISSTKSDVKGSGTVVIGDGITLYSEGFSTVTPEADNPVSILAESKATIGAKCDWTYGPAVSTTATTAEQRAIKTAGVYAPLTFDTENPITRVGHTITLADPIIAKGDVTKKGEGVLVFAAPGNVVDYRFTVQEGQIAIADALDTSDWEDVLTAKEFVGLDGAAANGFAMKIVVNDDGTETLQLRRKKGSLLIIK